jgi:hypothetical protein
MDILSIGAMFFYLATVLLWFSVLVVPVRRVGPYLASWVMLAVICYEWPFAHDPEGSATLTITMRSLPRSLSS